MSSSRSTRPSPWWLLVPTTLLVTASVATMTSQVSDLYTNFVCWANEHNEPELCDRDALSEVLIGLAVAVILCGTLVLWVTASWVGSLSDRYGRTRILALAVTGSLIAQLSAIIAYLFASTQVPYIYLLVFGGVIFQGGLGGMAGITAVTRAYLTDTTTEANRASILSVHLGLNNLAVILGTILGNTKLVYSDPLWTYCIFAGICAAYVIYLCVIPDSLTNEEKLQRQAAYRSNIRDDEMGRPLQTAKRIASQCNPLASFGPTTNTSGAPFRRIGGRNWNLAILTVGFLMSSSAADLYGMTVDKSLGVPWPPLPTDISISLYSQGALVFAFLIFFPTLKRAVTPRPVAPLTISKEEGLNSIAWDFKIGRISIVALLTSYIFLALFRNSLPWIAPVLIGVLGVVFRPALMSVIVSMYERQGGDHTGRLLGGLAVMEEISTFSAFGLFEHLDNSPALAIAPAAILAVLYFGYRHVRLPDIYLGTTERDSDEEELLLGDN